MIYRIYLLLVLFIGTQADLSAQVIVKDTVSKSDTTVGKKLEKLGQSVIKDTVKKKETEKDTVLEKKLETRFYSFRQFEHETFLFVKAPTKWHGSDWLRVGIVVGATMALMPFDQSITNSSQGDQHYFKSVPVIGGRVYGE